MAEACRIEGDCRLVNDKLQRRKRKKDIARRLPVERTHGEIIILPLTDGKLFYKIVKRIETMRSIEFLVVFSMTAFYLAVMSGCERSDLLMLDTKLFKRFLEECRRLFLTVPHLVCKLKSVICLNAFYGIWELLHYVFQENSRGTPAFRFGLVNSTLSQVSPIRYSFFICHSSL